MANGALTRVDLVSSPPERFDHDFATKMVTDHQAALDRPQKGAGAGARRRGWPAMLRDIAPTMLQQQADAMALVAALPAPRPTARCSFPASRRGSAGRTPASTPAQASRLNAIAL